MTRSSIAPDGYGPTICIGEILVEIVATTVGDGFREAEGLLSGPYPSGAPAIFSARSGRIGGSAAAVGTVGICIPADGARTDAPGFVVGEKDPTDAGDCFGEASVPCRPLGMAPGDALTCANAAGAREVTFHGPMAGAGTIADLDAFIASTERRKA